MSFQDEELMNDFLAESAENLDQLERHLVVLEKEPTNSDIISSIFRTVHTLKGTSGFLGLSKLELIAHKGENLLVKLRDGHLLVNSEIITALLSLLDTVRGILKSLENTKTEGDVNAAALLETFERLQGGGVLPTGVPVPAAVPSVQSTPPLEPALEPTTVRVESIPNEPSPLPAPASTSTPTSEALEVNDNAIRVHVGLLDRLMNLVGELVLARNQVIQYTVSQDFATLLSTSQRLNLITSELQEGIMKTRMQPINTVWNKFPRVVRDLSKACGKDVVLEMEGKETELDRTLIESIKDPLTHLVRNSVDHGIESPERRKSAGKPSQGKIVLRAYHEGGKVNIEIKDDGGGLDVEKLKAKALQKKLISAEQAAGMSDRELFNLIYLPGFSTAEKVTNVSGRGVGMDVVKTNIERIGGSIDIQSQMGTGTTIRIKIPLTLAIIPALIVTSGGERFAIPQVNLLELVRLDGEEAMKSIEQIKDKRLYRLRGQLLQLVYLNQELRLDSVDRSQTKCLTIVVLQSDERAFGLVVDDVSDTGEIVVKPMGKQLKGLPAFAGATIMGDGRVALILDVFGLAQRAGFRTRETAALAA